MTVNTDSTNYLEKQILEVGTTYQNLLKQDRQIYRLGQRIKIRQYELSKGKMFSDIAWMPAVFDDQGWLYPDNPKLLEEDAMDVKRYNFELSEASKQWNQYFEKCHRLADTLITRCKADISEQERAKLPALISTLIQGTTPQEANNGQ